MGAQAVPLILEALERDGGHWFVALRAVTGANPVSSQARGRTKAMTKAWLSWAEENGYQWQRSKR